MTRPTCSDVPRARITSPGVHPKSGLPDFGINYVGRSRIDPTSAERSTPARERKGGG